MAPPPPNTSSPLSLLQQQQQQQGSGNETDHDRSSSTASQWPVFFDQDVAGWKCCFLDVEASIESYPNTPAPPLAPFGSYPMLPDPLKDLLKLGRNQESLGELFVAFFDHFATKHDYNNSVVSIRVDRAGGLLSKREKDWTMRHGSERHLVCIEDPFELSHDLGRTIDKISVGEQMAMMNGILHDWNIF